MDRRQQRQVLRHQLDLLLDEQVDRVTALDKGRKRLHRGGRGRGRCRCCGAAEDGFPFVCHEEDAAHADAAHAIPMLNQAPRLK